MLLSEGQLQVLNVRNMVTEIILPTYHIHEAGLTADDHLSQLRIASELPRHFDCAQENYATIFTTVGPKKAHGDRSQAKSFV